MRKNYVAPIFGFLCGVVITLIVIRWWFPCMFCSTPPNQVEFQNSGNIPNDSLDNYIWRVFHDGSGNFMIPYNAANIQVTVAGDVTTLSDDGQDCSYTGTGTYVKYNPSGLTFMSTTNTISSDLSRSVTVVGPFDPTAGVFTSVRGRLHYIPTGGTDSTLCPISRLVWVNQGTGGIVVGYLTQTDITQ